MHSYKVGVPFQGTLKQYPEGAIYTFHGHHQLVLFVKDLRPSELRDIRRGTVHFGLSVYGPVIHLHFRFARAIPWSHAPYSYHLIESDEKSLPKVLDGKTRRATLQVIVVKADDGLVRAIRLLTFDPLFSAKLHQAITEQAQTPWDPSLYDRSLKVTDSWTPEGLLEDHGIARCAGGKSPVPRDGWMED